MVVLISSMALLAGDGFAEVEDGDTDIAEGTELSGVESFVCWRLADGEQLAGTVRIFLIMGKSVVVDLSQDTQFLCVRLASEDMLEAVSDG